MPKAYPKEFRDDVVAVARKGQAPLSQIAKDFGTSEGSLSNWLKRADVADGHRPGLPDEAGRRLTALVVVGRSRGSCRSSRGVHRVWDRVTRPG